MEKNMNLTDKKRALIFVSIVISCIASSMLATALTTALPAIIRELDVSITTGQWLTSGYSLAMGIMTPLTAFLITRFPTKNLYLTGMLLSILGMALNVFAPTFPIMMAARIMQACGNGILIAMAQVIILTIYPLEKRGTAMGWYGLSISAAPVIAPTLAGIVVDSIGWRAIFYIAIAIMIVSFIWAFCVFDNVLETSKRQFDVASFLLSILAFGGITLGIGNIGSFPFLSKQILPFIGIGCIGILLFTYRQLHLDQPFLELRLLKNKDYTISVLGSMMLYFVMMGSTVVMPLYIQSVLGKSATISGLVVLPGSALMAISSPLAGRILDKTGMKQLFVTGAACMLISNIGMALMNMDTPVWIAAVLNSLRTLSIGCLLMPLVTWGTSNIDQKLTAHGTALLTSLRTIAGAIGAAVFVGIMNAVANKYKGTWGAQAPMLGVKITFLCMGMSTLILLCLAVFGMKGKKKIKA